MQAVSDMHIEMSSAVAPPKLFHWQMSWIASSSLVLQAHSFLVSSRFTKPSPRNWSLKNSESFKCWPDNSKISVPIPLHVISIIYFAGTENGMWTTCSVESMYRGTKLFKHEFSCNLRFCDIIILFGTTCKSNTVRHATATTVPFHNISILCTRNKNNERIYHFPESSKSRMKMFEKPHVAREPQFGHPWTRSFDRSLVNITRSDETRKTSTTSQNNAEILGIVNVIYACYKILGVSVVWLQTDFAFLSVQSSSSVLNVLIVIKLNANLSLQVEQRNNLL